MTRTIQYLLLVLRVTGVVAIGGLLNEAVAGSGILFWIIIFLVFLFSMARYPREEVFAAFGLVFGFIGLFVLGGVYLLVKNGFNGFAAIWFMVWLAVAIKFRNPVQKWLTPTYFVADKFCTGGGSRSNTTRAATWVRFNRFREYLVFHILDDRGFARPHFLAGTIGTFARLAEKTPPEKIYLEQALSICPFQPALPDDTLFDHARTGRGENRQKTVGWLKENSD
ncbi:MAG: hypothetical protein ACE5HS_05590 [bacterium]